MRDVFLSSPLWMAALVAVAAQLWKGRTGIGWFLLALIAFGVMFSITALAVPGRYPSEVLAMTSSLVSGAVMLVIVASLPNRRTARTEPADRRPRVPCPVCRELILLEAEKCRFCGTQLMPLARNSNALKRPVERS
jgi:hypothetical protein